MENVYTLNSKLVGKEVVICGTGSSAKEAYFSLCKEGVRIKHFSDRDERLAGKLLFGLRIIREDDLIGKDYTVIIASESYRDIEERLKSKGITNLYLMDKYLRFDYGITI